MTELERLFCCSRTLQTGSLCSAASCWADHAFIHRTCMAIGSCCNHFCPLPSALGGCHTSLAVWRPLGPSQILLAREPTPLQPSFCFSTWFSKGHDMMPGHVIWDSLAVTSRVPAVNRVPWGPFSILSQRLAHILVCEPCGLTAGPASE